MPQEQDEAPAIEEEEHLGLTPYQGPYKTFGFFKCTECNRSWASAHSWANTCQKCEICRIDVYPFSQRPLWRKKNKKNATEIVKRHQDGLCGKCEELGETCVSKSICHPPPRAGAGAGRRRRRRRRRQPAAGGGGDPPNK